MDFGGEQDPVEILKAAVAVHREGRPEQAVELYRRALPGLEDPVYRRQCLLWLGSALSDTGDLAAAATSCRAALDLDPQHLAGLITESALALAPGDIVTLDMATHIALARGVPAEARRFAEASLARRPANQRALSLLALALIQLGCDAEVARLLDFDRLLRVGRLEPPPGFGPPSSFDAALADAVAARTELDRRHLGKTMVGGARLHDSFVIGDPLAGALRQAFLAAARGYAETLAVAPDHPMARTRPAALDLISWANIVVAKEFELPHIHDGSWLSGVYYPEMPPADPQDPDSGAIELGGHDLGDALKLSGPTRRVRPEAGTLVLFPAYFYHRTLPFAGAGRRISIAFDIRVET